MNGTSGAGDGQLEEIRPCLIGGFQERGALKLLPESSGGVPRFEPCETPEGSISSLDMVRLRLKFGGGDDFVARFEDKLQRLDSLQERYDMKRSRPGRYAHLYTFAYGDSTVSLGIGQFVKGVKADMRRGFVEFNPNKLGSDDGFAEFVQLVAKHVVRCGLVRFDFAVDLPVARSLVRTRKDRRKYSFEQGAVLTEYLGVRNAVGRVKVYDKAAELGLDGVDLTRIEVTCSGDWSLAQMMDKWPTVYRVRPYDESSDSWVAVMAGLLGELVETGGSPEKYLNNLNSHTRKKVRRMAEGVTFPCPAQGALHVLFQAMKWAGRFSGQEVA